MAASQQSGTEGGYAAKPSFTPHSIIGVVGDVRREMMGHHYAEVTPFTLRPDMLTMFR